MLTELSIRDIALFPRLSLSFGPGLNVFSGETGAGKSLVVGSLRLLCGARAPEGAVRTGADRGIVEGIFQLDPEGWIAERLTELGIELEDGELILRREIAPGAKGRVRANGSAITLATLTKASELLIDLHGQHAHQSLLQSSFQREALDEHGDLLELREEFARVLGEWKAAVEELERVRAASKEDRDRRELARFQLRELDAVAPAEGEFAAIEAERRRLERAELLQASAARLVDSLSEGERSVHDVVSELETVAEGAAEHDRDWRPVAEGLRSLAITAADVAADARRLGEAAVHDPERLEQVRERGRVLGDLLRKYGPEESDLLAFWRRLREEEADPEAPRRRAEALEEQVQGISDRLRLLGEKLSRKRKSAARGLENAVEDVLEELGMEGTRFQAHVSPRSRGLAVKGADFSLRAGPSGLDSVDFLLAANRGEEMRKLSATASGGEISRIMLALKSVLGKARGTAMMVFDEIDIGVGGVIAGKIATLLSSIAEDRQVLCITHLAAIASRANVHLRVHKRESDGRTVSDVDPVTGERRVREIARMLGSDEDRGVAMDHARALLKGAHP